MIDLQRVIKDFGLTQSQLSSILGVSQTAISQVVNGKMDMPSNWNEILEAKFNIDLSNYYQNISNTVAEPTAVYEKNTNSKVNDLIKNLSESNKVMAESNKILSESNKILSESIQKALEVHSKVMQQLLEMEAVK